MDAKTLIELLLKVPPQTPVMAWDADAEEYQNVSGIVWADDGSELMIETDEL